MGCGGASDGGFEQPRLALGILLGQVPQQQREFIAAEARHHVGGAHVAREYRGHRLEERVARGMAVAVVDGLEPVEIDIDERGAGAVTLGVGERALQLALEAASVEHVGERIDLGARLEIGHLRPCGGKLTREPLDLFGEPHGIGAPC